jgi:RHS repeat-associated protein
MVLQDGLYTHVYGLDLISATDSGGTQTHLHYDGLGSTVNLTDGAGTVFFSYWYDVFGAVRHQSGAGPANFWQFTGEWRDSGSGLDYLRARHYDAGTGRFLSRDPAMVAHAYAYVENSPTNFVDPYGLGLFGDIKGCISDPLDCGQDVVEAGACLANPMCVLTEAAGLIPPCTAFRLGGRDVSCQIVATCVVNLLIECGPVYLAKNRADQETATRFPGQAGTTAVASLDCCKR